MQQTLFVTVGAAIGCPLLLDDYCGNGRPLHSSRKTLPGNRQGFKVIPLQS